MDFLTLDVMMRAVRLLCSVIAGVILTSWYPSFWRVVRRRDAPAAGGIEGDGARAIWVTLAAAVLLFQVRWLAPGLTDLARARVWLVAQVAMTGTLLAAIYHHGATRRGFDLRRTMLVHLAMLVLCVMLASVAR